MRILALPCLLAVLACVPAPAAAQWDPDTTMAPPGTRMRVGNEGEWRMGRFWYLRADTVWLIGERDQVRMPVPLSGDERIEITRGHRREMWSAIGALTGVALGIAGSQINGNEDGPSGSARNTSEAVYAAAGGAVIGGLVGWFVAPQRWRPVQRPPSTPPPPPAQTASALPATQP